MSAAKRDVSITSKPDAKGKRKREDGGEDGGVEADGRVFTIKQSASDPFGRPLTLTPLHLLPRAKLPLAYLDVSQSAANRFFSAHIHILENSHSHGMEVTVLVAREAGGRMFAVERVSWRKYAICRLAEWVKVEHLNVTAKETEAEMNVITKKRRSMESNLSISSNGGRQDWWKAAAVDTPMKNEIDATAALPKLDMRPLNLDASKVSNFRVQSRTGSVEQDNLQNNPGVLDSAAPAPQTAQDVLQELAKHYLEALYVTRTSLAYFTKGPLSRARASAATEGPVSTCELVDFFRTCILTSTTMDKKYRDGIAGIVKVLPVRSPTDSSPVVPKKKKKRKWKPKRDKAGLFVDEQEYVEKWWTEADHDESPGTESADTVLRKRIARIRNRETFLQLILCLEVLALENSISIEDRDRHEAGAPGAESQNMGETQQEDTQVTTDGTKKSKPKKKQDLITLLETLLDKLTIWYSLESHSPLKARTGAAAETSQPLENDELRNFCLEVILPFYVSRIPQQANSVNQKLGGPSAPSPVKRKASSKATKEISRKPGEPAVRQPPPEKKSRQPLSRTSTETERQLLKQRHSIPSLQRSSTDSDVLLTHIKRENSESVPPLDSIPVAKTSVKPQRGSRASLMSSLTRREVDLTAMSAASEAKMKKKAEVEERLREAISTLKKPNRAAAVKEVAANADASFAKALTKGRGEVAKGRTGVAGAAMAKDDKSWLIAATPSRHGRTVKVVKATPYNGQTAPAHQEPDGRLDAPSSASSALVPSSSARLKAEPLPTSTPAIPVTGHRPRHQHLQVPKPFHGVEETPSRGFARFMPPGLAREPGTLDPAVTLESPIAARKAAVEQTPSKPLKAISFAGTGLASTPLRPPAGPLVEASPNLPHKSGGGEGKERSIYETLGWDDDGYEPLA